MQGSKTVYEFGPFRIDPAERLLTREGIVIPLTAKTFDTLMLLVRNSGHMLEKREMLQHIWPDTFVEEANLAQNISILRKALGERPGSREYIETIPRRGYRFIAPVRETSRPETPGADSPEAAPLSGQQKQPIWFDRRHLLLYGIPLALIVLSGFLAWRMDHPARLEAGYTQLTDFTDSAIAPALSPDGRTVAFIRGTEWFLSRGQIWLKQLPDGEPVQLTDDPRRKFAPAFSLDGTRLSYSAVEPERTQWDTFTVPVLGGKPQLLMRNAQGLTWLSERQLLFSEFKTGIHLAVITARENRTDSRDVYVPEHQRAMAHFSYASPDRKWVLVIEMDHTTAWQPCRLVPFDGSSPGRQVGPEGACTSAGWSPDGQWMYFTVATPNGQHLWRQPFPEGLPEQLTFGVTQGQGVAVAPDGRSVITSIGMEQSAIWIHGARGDQPISSVGNAFSPQFSADGKRVFYLLRRGSHRSQSTHLMRDSGNELWGADAGSGQSERLVSGFAIGSYDVAQDGNEAVFAAESADGMPQIWLAQLDRSSSPRLIASSGDAPFFCAGGQILFRVSDGKANYLYRMNRDGSGHEKVVPYPINNVMSVSPDGRWAATFVPVNDALAHSAQMAIPIQGGAAIRICSGFCVARWAPDGRYLYVTVEPGSGFAPGKTVAIPVAPGKMLPELPRTGIRSVAEGLALSGGRVIGHSSMAPGPDPSIYAYVKGSMHRNLFRIPLP